MVFVWVWGFFGLFVFKEYIPGFPSAAFILYQLFTPNTYISTEMITAFPIFPLYS